MKKNLHFYKFLDIFVYMSEIYQQVREISEEIESNVQIVWYIWHSQF